MSERREEEKDLSQLLQELSQETATLVRQELAHVKAEIAQKGKSAALGGGMLGAAAIMGLASFGSLTVLIILALSLVLTPWLSALIVTAAYAASAGLLALRGRRKLKEATPPVPEQAKESIKEDVRWAKDQRRSAGT
jgi:hypothetical protein